MPVFNHKTPSGQWQQIGGPSGKTGATFTPAVADNGDLSWSNDGDLPNPEIVNLRGPKGEDGAAGAQGPAGYTPVKGTDYFTEADKTEIINSVINSLPTWEGGSY